MALFKCEVIQSLSQSTYIMNSFIKKIDTGYRLFAKCASWLQPMVLLVVRLYWGWQFFQAGWGKFKDLTKPTEYFSSLGIPFPMLNATIVATTECVGGLLLLVGLASRLASIPLTITMIVAYATAEREALQSIFSDTDKFLESAPFLFLFATVLVLAFGPGVFSLDYLIKQIMERKRAG
jgi:putative oxidoreductase